MKPLLSLGCQHYLLKMRSSKFGLFDKILLVHGCTIKVSILYVKEMLDILIPPPFITLILLDPPALIVI